MDAIRAMLRPKLLRAQNLWRRPVMKIVGQRRLERKRAFKTRTNLLRLFVGASIVGWFRNLRQCIKKAKRDLQQPSTPLYHSLSDDDAPATSGTASATHERRGAAIIHSSDSDNSDGEPPSKRSRPSEPTTLAEKKQVLTSLLNSEDEVAEHLYQLLKLYQVFRPYVDLRPSADRPSMPEADTSDPPPEQQQPAGASEVARRRQRCEIPEDLSLGQQAETVFALMQKHPQLTRSLFTIALPWKLVDPNSAHSPHPSMWELLT